MTTIVISQLPPSPPITGSGSTKGTDLVPATDVTATTPISPGGTTNKYTQAEILGFQLEAEGLITYQACRVTTVINQTATYNNGSSGVGATLTNAGAMAPIEFDDVVLALNDRVLVAFQASPIQNGIYFVSNTGSSSANWVLTRATDYDTTAEIVQYGVVLINQGTEYAGTLFEQLSATPIFIGTSPITFGEFKILSSSAITIPVPISQGGTGATTILGAQTNLELLPGTNVEAWSANLDSLAALSGTGFIAQTGTNTFSERTLTGTTNQLNISNTAGVAGNPVFSISSTLILPGTATLGGNLTVAGHSIVSTSNGNIPIIPNGTGVIQLTNAQLESNLDVNGNSITNAATNGNVTIVTNGSGLLVLNATQGVNGISNDGTMAADSATLLPTQAAVKAYANTAAAGFTFITPPAVANQASNFSATYNNGTAGVGATLTQSVAAVVVVDGVTLTLNQYVLFSGQSSAFQNGLYQITTLGTSMVQAVFTRSTTYDTTAQIVVGSLISVSGGNTYAGSIWMQTNTVNTIGTDPINFIEFAQPSNTFVTLSTIQTITGAKSFNAGKLILNGSSSGSTILNAAAVAGSGTITLPTGTDTLMGLATVATVSGAKTFNNSTLVLAGSSSGTSTLNAAAVAGSTVFTLPGTTDTLVGAVATQTLTNKTMSGLSNTFSNISYASLANGTAGNLITWDAGGSPALVGTGNAGYLLTSNGAGAAPTFQAPGTFTNITCQTITFNPTTDGIVGTTTNDSASTGFVGEYVSSVDSVGTTIGAGTPTSVRSISLTAGDWDVEGTIAGAPSNVNNAIIAGISTTNNAFESPSIGTINSIAITNTANPNILAGNAISTPTVRISISSTTTVYLIAQVNNGGGSPTVFSFMRARRIR